MARAFCAWYGGVSIYGSEARSQGGIHLAQFGRSRWVERLVHHSRDRDAENGYSHPSSILPSNALLYLDVEYKFLRAQRGQPKKREARRSTHVESSGCSDESRAHGKVDKIPDKVCEPVSADGVAEFAREGVEVDLTRGKGQRSLDRERAP